jgi:hypothetical protein
MKSFDQRIYREEFRAKRQPKKKRGPYKCKGLTKDWKAYKRAYYLARLKNGICTSCGNPNPDSPNRTTCGTCRARAKAKACKITTP